MGFPSKKGGGLKGGCKPKRQGVYQAPSGRTIVHASDYMSALHQAAVKPIPVPGAPNTGKTDLHHGPNPSGGIRHDCDAAVVPLAHDAHMYIEFDSAGPGAERALLPVFGEWSALHWFSYHKGLLDDPERGQKFLAWVIEKVNEEQNA